MQIINDHSLTKSFIVAAGEWYGKPAEMSVVSTYDAEFAKSPFEPKLNNEESQQEASATSAAAGQVDEADGGDKADGCDMGSNGPPVGSMSNSEGKGMKSSKPSPPPQPVRIMRRVALLEFTFES